MSNYLVPIMAPVTYLPMYIQLQPQYAPAYYNDDSDDEPESDLSIPELARAFMLGLVEALDKNILSYRAVHNFYAAIHNAISHTVEDELGVRKWEPEPAYDRAAAKANALINPCKEEAALLYREIHLYAYYIDELIEDDGDEYDSGFLYQLRSNVILAIIDVSNDLATSERMQYETIVQGYINEYDMHIIDQIDYNIKFIGSRIALAGEDGF